MESAARVRVLALARRVLRWVRPGVANIADKDSTQSVAIAASLLEAVLSTATPREGAVSLLAPLSSATEEVYVATSDPATTQAAQTAGRNFEDEVCDYARAELRRLAPDVGWTVERGRTIDEFLQYRYLATVETLVQNDDSGLLRDALGTDYVVKPDVVVGRRASATAEEYLHASLSCKWTIRSDRVQNARHEANVLLQRRRGRAPHIIAVTAEPLPSRLASIARGTGEIDRTYHLALPELQDAVSKVGNPVQSRVLGELMANDRLADLSELPESLLY